jgi:hypothetical protein
LLHRTFGFWHFATGWPIAIRVATGDGHRPIGSGTKLLTLCDVSAHFFAVLHNTVVIELYGTLRRSA